MAPPSDSMTIFTFRKTEKEDWLNLHSKLNISKLWSSWGLIHWMSILFCSIIWNLELISCPIFITELANWLYILAYLLCFSIWLWHDSVLDSKEAYEEFKHVLLAFIYDKDDQTSPVVNEVGKFCQQLTISCILWLI